MQDSVAERMTPVWPFEKTFVVAYTGYKDRLPGLYAELDRQGLVDRETMWQFPSPYNKWAMDMIPHIPFFDSHPGCWGACIGQYKSIKTGYELGFNTILIVEDDCRFLLDDNEISKSLCLIPADWDVLMFDHFKLRGDVVKVNDRWVKCRASASTACYALNRKAMARMIDMYESPVNGRYSHPVMRNCDHWTDTRYLGSDVNLYCAVPNVAVQTKCFGGSNCGVNHCDGKYEELGINWDTDYARF